MMSPELLMLLVGAVIAAAISVEFLRPVRQTSPF